MKKKIISTFLLTAIIGLGVFFPATSVKADTTQETAVKTDTKTDNVIVTPNTLGLFKVTAISGGNIRAGIGYVAPIIASVPSGTTLELAYPSPYYDLEGNMWYKVVYQGTYGYIDYAAGYVF